MRILCITTAILTGSILSCAGPDQASVLDMMEFETIQPGSFNMGSPSDEVGRYADEEPLHTVTINYHFEILSTEVSQRMWQEVMGTNPSTFQGLDKPVETVSWDDCQLFIQELNLLDEEHYYRLPSEAEWEYACRAGTITPYYSGSDEEHLNTIGWYVANSEGINQPVAGKISNQSGLYDMSGNVWEWCEDSYHENYQGAPDDGSPWISQGIPDRVARGGSVGSPARRCRSAARDQCYQGFRYMYLGFRVVRMSR